MIDKILEIALEILFFFRRKRKGKRTTVPPLGRTGISRKQTLKCATAGGDLTGSAITFISGKMATSRLPAPLNG